MPVGLPEMVPALAVKCSPAGRVPCSLRTGVGTPLEVNVAEPVEPTVNVRDPADSVGADGVCSTTSVNVAVADPTLLAGGALFAFTGFFDISYRKHDYDYGRVVAQEKLRAYRDDSKSVFAGLHWIPRNIDPVNPQFNNLPMTRIDRRKRQNVYKQIMGACDDLFSELGMSWLVRKGVESFFVGKRLKSMLAL